MKKLVVFTLLFIMPCFSSAELYLTIWKYHGHKMFRSANVMTMTPQEGRFLINKIGEMNSINYGSGDCQSLLAYNQKLPLEIMRDRNYLSNDQVLAQRAVELAIQPEQVTFIETSELVAGDGANEKVTSSLRVNKSKKGVALKKVYDIRKGVLKEKRVATIWMVSGQSVDTNGINQFNLPWQLDADFTDIKLSRDKYPFVWEVGRYGQSAPGQMQANLGALAILASQEMRALGVDPAKQEGYLFIHSLDKVRTKYFETRFNAQRFPLSWKNNDHSVLIVKLSDALKFNPPEDVSHRIHRLIELSKGQLVPEEALHLIHTSLSSVRSDLTYFAAKKDPGPLVLEDTTFEGFRNSILTQTKKLNLSSDAEQKIIQYLSQFTFIEEPSNNQYKHRPYIRNLFSRFARFNLFHLSNLSPTMAKSHPKYIEKALAGTYLYLKNKSTVGNEENIFRILVRTTDPIVHKQLEQLGPSQEPLGTEPLSLHKGERKIYFHLFTEKELEKLSEAHKGNPPLVGEGHWAKRRLLAHPMQF